MPRHSAPMPSIHRQTRLNIQRAFRRHPSAESNATQEELRVQSATEGFVDVEHSHRLALVLGIAAVGFFVVAVLRRGWISDDAFITMRAVDHLINGRGFVYNAGERVLGFTNPLWALLLSIPYLVVRDPYWAPIIGSVVASTLFGLVLVFRSGTDYRTGALLLLALSFSRSFVDFSTSGLENPLSHLLLLLFYLEYIKLGRDSVLRLSLFAALLLVNRFDSMPLWLPPLVFAYRANKRLLDRKALLIGWSPAILWFAFATVYYGFPLPNTAYAKLNADIPRVEMLRQGLSYLVDALVHDPQTIILIAAALLVLQRYAFPKPAKVKPVAESTVDHERSPEQYGHLALAASIALLLELAYVVAIGGDFMSGRFLTPSVAVAAVVLVKFGEPFLLDSRNRNAVLLGLAALVACLAFSPLRDDPIREKRDFPVTRIVNERAWFQEHLAMWVNLRPVQWKAYGLYGEGVNARNQHRRVVLFNNVGMFAWGAGPNLHVVDDMALTDPLLARIPFEYREDWRTGHLPRAIPDGYLDSLETGQNVIRDPCIAEAFNLISQVVRGPLLSSERFAAIVALNLPGGMTVKACPDRIPSPARQDSFPAAPAAVPPTDANSGATPPVAPAAPQP
ncbi:MAG TPA: hypothetical protein VIV60_26155 [Polyangiaceae bacterium]